MFYHNAQRYETFDEAAKAAAIAARNGEVQAVTRASDNRQWSGLFRRYDAPEVQAQAQAQAQQAPTQAQPSAMVDMLIDLIKAQAATQAELRELHAKLDQLVAAKAKAKAPKTPKAPAQTLPDDPIGF